MITIKTCFCGRSHDASAWSALELVRHFVDAGEQRQARRCRCGRELAVTTLEDDCAQEIDRAWFDCRQAYSRARLECAMLRAARAGSFPSRWASFVMVRAEARAARATAKQLEAVLESIYRAREYRSPKQRVGRNLVVVDGDADGEAKTERPRAAR